MAIEYFVLIEDSIMASTQTRPFSSKSATVQTDSETDLQQAIQLRALELYEQRGRESGQALEDWLQAETELAPQRTKKAAA